MQHPAACLQVLTAACMYHIRMHVCSMYQWSPCLSFAVAQAAEGLSRAQRGGMISASQAFAVLGLLRGAARLKRTIQNAAAKHAKRPEDFAPLLRAIKARLSLWGWGQSCMVWLR